ncbi:HlyD family secretion protein [Sphingobacterium spiritivorum]|uniref:HlyD family secretion protein n=1 Tax=Sphingobacterium spiritivorum TaxID=258 RepID=UPI003DA321B2
MKRYIGFLPSLVLVLAFGACKNENKNSDHIIEGKIERDQLSIVTKVPGKIEKILVSEGQHVRKGDTLIMLEIPEVTAKEEQAKGALDAAEAQYEMARKGATDGQLKQLNAKVAGLKEQLDFAEKSLNRLSNLLRDSLVPQQKYDEVYAKYQGAKNQYIAAQAELSDVRNGARVEQQRMALGQKERALGAVNEVSIAAKERFLIAPQDMTVESINLKVGELALAGYAIVNGYLDETTYFRFTLTEKKMAALRQGAEVNVRIPYKDNQVVKGSVSYIKALNSYANIATAYPDFDQQESLFEIKVVPTDKNAARELLTKSNATLDISSMATK